MQELTRTHQINVDQLVQSIIEIITSVFDDRILSIYLAGSLSRDQLTTSSDIDMTIVFRNSVTTEEYDRFLQLQKSLQPLSPFRLDMSIVSENKIKVRPANASIRNSRCLYGEAFLHQVPAQTIEAYAMRSIHKAIHYMSVLRGKPTFNPAPLEYPNSQDIYYGYTQYGDFAGANSFKQGTRIIVDMVTRCTTAIIAIELGIESDTKQESINQYHSQIGGKWKNFVVEIVELIRNKLHYGIPASSEDQTQLHTLCISLLAFENDAITRFKPVILQCLQSDDRRQRKLALVALKNIQFKDEKILQILDASANVLDDELLDEVNARYAH